MSISLDSLYIFDGISKEEVAYFLLMSQSQHRRKGEAILTIGDQSNGCAYYINSGHVKVVRGGNEIALLGPGSFFGEMALITDEPRTATVEVIDDTELQVFLKEDFLILLNKSSHTKEIKEEIMRRIKEMVRH
jgi:CRP/FNR family transcriptional regulator, cyclic AMP receptor protein